MRLGKAATTTAVIVAALIAVSVVPTYGAADESPPPFTVYPDTTYGQLKDLVASLAGRYLDPGAPGLVNVYGEERKDTESPIDAEGPAGVSAELLGSFKDTPDTATFDDIRGRIDISRRIQARVIAFRVTSEGRSFWVMCISESGGPLTCIFLSPLW